MDNEKLSGAVEQKNDQYFHRVIMHAIHVESNTT